MSTLEQETAKSERLLRRTEAATYITETYGIPASTLTDNGLVYTARFRGSRNAFEYLLATMDVTQKNGHPYHPQTQGKIERFHQTLKRWLSSQPAADTLPDLQRQLDTFQQIYNHDRVHRAHGQTPAAAYNATLKAGRGNSDNPHIHYRVRIDIIDRFGKLTLRRAGRLHHLGVGTEHANTPILMLVNEHTVEVINPTNGQHLASNTIDPDRNYWRNNQKTPGRWPRPIPS